MNGWLFDCTTSTAVPSVITPSVPTSALKLARRGPSDYGVISRTEALDCSMHASNHLVLLLDF
uniref:hypothetical protein n=1 Tax=Orrella sp. TaxID=1921583 RepID=UPI0040477000